MKQLTALLFLYLMLPEAVYSQQQERVDSLSIYFQFDQSKIDWEQESNWNALRSIRDLPRETNLNLAGYTDTIGSKEYNLALSSRRLQAVLTLLNDSFPGKLKVLSKKACGKDHSESELQANRRVVITYSNSSTSPIEIKGDKSLLHFELGVPFVLKLEFDFGSETLTSHSFREIESLVQVMKSDPDLHLLLKGYVCCGPDLNNLSGLRAERIKLSLIQAGGISSTRIQAIGLGNSKPLFPDDTEAHRQANRRVEATFYKK